MFPNFNIKIGCEKAHGHMPGVPTMQYFIAEDYSLNSGHYENFKNYIVKMWLIAIYDDNMSSI
jgi:hypothetical protein